jgi:hypothetical protein
MTEETIAHSTAARPHTVATIAARSADKSGRMRYVLGGSLALGVLLLFVTYLIV